MRVFSNPLASHSVGLPWSFLSWIWWISLGWYLWNYWMVNNILSASFSLGWQDVTLFKSKVFLGLIFLGYEWTSELREWSSPSRLQECYSEPPSLYAMWGPLAFSTGSFMGTGSEPCKSPATWHLPWCSGTSWLMLCFAGVWRRGGKVTSPFLRTFPSWVWASYWPLWVDFSVFFRKHLTVVMSPTDSIAQCLTASGSCESLPRNLLCHQGVDSNSLPLPWSQWLRHCTCVHVWDPIINFSVSGTSFSRWLALSKSQFFKL